MGLVLPRFMATQAGTVLYIKLWAIGYPGWHHAVYIVMGLVLPKLVHCCI